MSTQRDQHYDISYTINHRHYLLGPHVRMIAYCKPQCHLQLSGQLLCNSIMTAAIGVSLRPDFYQAAALDIHKFTRTVAHKWATP